MKNPGIAVVLTLLLFSSNTFAVDLVQGVMAGEVTETSVILQTRLTDGVEKADGDVPGAHGWAYFEIAPDGSFDDAVKTDWIEAKDEHDFIVKVKVGDLLPATRYYYRPVYGETKEETQTGMTGTFRTLAGADQAGPVRFTVVTGMNYAFFYHGTDGKGNRAYTGPDKALGFPALETMLNLKPDFFVGTGDNVYYDHPNTGRAQALPEMRRKWHEQFMQPRFVNFLANVPTYWEKDDHDHRFNDCDTTGDKAPSSDLGIKTFLEQVPVVDPNDPNPKTYRTHRVSKDLQIWLTEGRDYRSPNAMPDGPDKTLWGKEQLEWLKRTLLESDAAFKLLISPTPLVGPDDAYKRDNHVNPDGFRHEGDAFYAWLTGNGFLEKNFYLICGDRHWQYHSIHPSGFEEFSTGALVDANSRLGRLPGDPDSTDPNALVKQPYTQAEASGGFLMVQLQPSEGDTKPSITFHFYDENGEPLYSHQKTAK